MRSPRTHYAEPRALWEMRTSGCGIRCVRVGSFTPTTRAGEWEERSAFLMAFETDEATVYQVRCSSP